MNAGGAMNSTDLNGTGTMNATGNTGNSM
jgi:hypothetical protein